MIIRPILKDGVSSDVVAPLQVLVQNKSDVVILVLRLIRYLFQQGIAGEDLKWQDEDAGLVSGIYIEDSFPELIDMDNPRASIIISEGGIVYDDRFLNENRGYSNLGVYTVASMHNLGIQLTVIGRNKLETRKISEAIAASMFVLKPQILNYTPNIERIGPISVGSVTPMNRVGQSGDSPFFYQTTVNFSVEYKLEFPMDQCGDFFTAFLYTINATNTEETVTVEVAKTTILKEDI